MTNETRNDAPERLYTLLAEFIRDERAAERRATVERIRERLLAHGTDRIYAWLDEEAARA